MTKYSTLYALIALMGITIVILSASISFAALTPIIPIVPIDICGDGSTTGSEECDDGNTTSGDGCSSTCKIEYGSGPTQNPPAGDVTPTFSGLYVTGDADIDQHLTVEDLLVMDSSILTGDTGFFGWVTFFNNIETYGDIKSSGDIGSFYTRTTTFSVSTGGIESPAAECFAGEWLSGCSAYMIYDNSSDRFYGTYPEGDRTCRAVVRDGGGAADTVNIYARCFDPDGVRSGTYSY